MHPQEHVLGDVLRFRPAAEHPERDAEDPVLVAPHEILEGARVPGTQPRDEVTVVRHLLPHG